MESVIAKLWEYELDGWQASATAQEMLHRLAKQYDALAETLNEEQKKALAAYDEQWGEYAGVTEKEAFTRAFRLGMRLGMEVLTNPNE